MMNLNRVNCLVTAAMRGESVSYPFDLTGDDTATSTALLLASGHVHIRHNQHGTVLPRLGLAQSQSRETSPLLSPLNSVVWKAGIAAQRALNGCDVLGLFGDLSLEDIQDAGKAKSIQNARDNLADRVGVIEAAKLEEKLQDAAAWQAFLRTANRTAHRTRNEALRIISEQGVAGDMFDVAANSHGSYERSARIASRYGYRLVTYRGKKGRTRAIVYRSHADQSRMTSLRTDC